MKRCSPALLRSLALCLVTALVGAGSARADFYLQNNQNAGWNWNTTAVGNTSAWFNATTGSGQPTAMDSAGTYHTNGKLIRTRDSNSATDIDLFLGNTLVFDGTGTVMVLKAGNGTAIASVGNLIVNSASSVSAGNVVAAGQNFSIGTLEQNATTTYYSDGTGSRGVNLAVNTLSGAGTIAFENRSTGTFNVSLNVSSASAFTGTFSLNSGSLKFNNSLSSAGALLFATGSTVNLNGQSITVSSLTVGSQTFTSGSFTSTELATYGITATGAGLITVSSIPEPSTTVLALGTLAGFVAFWHKRRR